MGHRRSKYPPSPSHQHPSHVAVIGALIAAIGTVIADTNTLVADFCEGYHCCDVQDGIFTFNAYRHHEKPWVAELVVPYLVFFAVACVVSLFTLGQKGKLLVDKFRQRQAASSNAVESVETLEEKLIANNTKIKKICCALLLGATEGARCDFRMFDAKKIVFPQPPLGSRMCQRCAACVLRDFREAECSR
jgi:hypothetical protein